MTSPPQPGCWGEDGNLLPCSPSPCSWELGSMSCDTEEVGSHHTDCRLTSKTPKGSWEKKNLLEGPWVMSLPCHLCALTPPFCFCMYLNISQYEQAVMDLSVQYLLTSPLLHHSQHSLAAKEAAASECQDLVTVSGTSVKGIYEMR